MKLLIIEPDQIQRRTLENFFDKENYLWESVANYPDASERVSMYEYDCILMNAILPDAKTFSLLEELNKTQKSDGIILFSSHNSPEDRVAALEMGADDFITTPFHFPELNARIQAVIRRKKFQAKSKLYFGNLVIDFNTKDVQVWDKKISLTKREYEILLYLISNKDKVVSTVMLSDYLWGEETYNIESHNSLAAHLKNIRKKLSAAKAELEIKNIYGVGYQIIEI